MVVTHDCIQVGIAIQVGKNHVKLIAVQTRISPYRAGFLCQIYSHTCMAIRNSRVPLTRAQHELKASTCIYIKSENVCFSGTKDVSHVLVCRLYNVVRLYNGVRYKTSR